MIGAARAARAAVRAPSAAGGEHRLVARVDEPFAVVHAHLSSMEMVAPTRGMWTLEVASGRLVFNASEMTGDVYTAMLEPE